MQQQQPPPIVACKTGDQVVKIVKSGATIEEVNAKGVTRLWGPSIGNESQGSDAYRFYREAMSANNQTAGRK